MEHASGELSTAPGVPTEGLEAAARTFCAQEGRGGCGKPHFMAVAHALYPWGLTSARRKH